VSVSALNEDFQMFLITENVHIVSETLQDRLHKWESLSPISKWYGGHFFS
jgi:hypothetical protein